MSRALKELRSLAPWQWDSRVTKHPPGAAALRDFEKIESALLQQGTPGHYKTRAESASKDATPVATPGPASVQRDARRRSGISGGLSTDHQAHLQTPAAGSAGRAGSAADGPRTVTRPKLKRKASELLSPSVGLLEPSPGGAAGSAPPSETPMAQSKARATSQACPGAATPACAPGGRVAMPPPKWTPAPSAAPPAITSHPSPHAPADSQPAADAGAAAPLPSSPTPPAACSAPADGPTLAPVTDAQPTSSVTTMQPPDLSGGAAATGGTAARPTSVIKLAPTTRGRFILTGATAEGDSGAAPRARTQQAQQTNTSGAAAEDGQDYDPAAVPVFSVPATVQQAAHFTGNQAPQQEQSFQDQGQRESPKPPQHSQQQFGGVSLPLPRSPLAARQLPSAQPSAALPTAPLHPQQQQARYTAGLQQAAPVGSAAKVAASCVGVSSAAAPAVLPQQAAGQAPGRAQAPARDAPAKGAGLAGSGAMCLQPPTTASKPEVVASAAASPRPSTQPVPAIAATEVCGNATASAMPSAAAAVGRAAAIGPGTAAAAALQVAGQSRPGREGEAERGRARDPSPRPTKRQSTSSGPTTEPARAFDNAGPAEKLAAPRRQPAGQPGATSDAPKAGGPGPQPSRTFPSRAPSPNAPSRPLPQPRATSCPPPPAAHQSVAAAPAAAAGVRRLTLPSTTALDLADKQPRQAAVRSSHASASSPAATTATSLSPAQMAVLERLLAHFRAVGCPHPASMAPAELVVAIAGFCQSSGVAVTATHVHTLSCWLASLVELGRLPPPPDAQDAAQPQRPGQAQATTSSQRDQQEQHQDVHQHSEGETAAAVPPQKPQPPNCQLFQSRPLLPGKEAESCRHPPPCESLDASSTFQSEPQCQLARPIVGTDIAMEAAHSHGSLEAAAAASRSASPEPRDQPVLTIAPLLAPACEPTPLAALEADWNALMSPAVTSLYGSLADCQAALRAVVLGAGAAAPPRQPHQQLAAPATAAVAGPRARRRSNGGSRGASPLPPLPPQAHAAQRPQRRSSSGALAPQQLPAGRALASLPATETSAAMPAAAPGARSAHITLAGGAPATRGERHGAGPAGSLPQGAAHPSPSMYDYIAQQRQPVAATQQAAAPYGQQNHPIAGHFAVPQNPAHVHYAPATSPPSAAADPSPGEAGCFLQLSPAAGGSLRSALSALAAAASAALLPGKAGPPGAAAQGPPGRPSIVQPGGVDSVVPAAIECGRPLPAQPATAPTAVTLPQGPAKMRAKLMFQQQQQLLLQQVRRL